MLVPTQISLVGAQKLGAVDVRFIKKLIRGFKYELQHSSTFVLNGKSLEAHQASLHVATIRQTETPE